MIIFEIRILLAILVFILMIITGISLTRKGKPYNVILFNIHKLISLGAVAMLIITILHYSSNTELVRKEIIFFITTGILFLALIVTGGLLNIKKEMPKFILILHRIFPILLVASAFLTVYYLVV